MSSLQETTKNTSIDDVLDRSDFGGALKRFKTPIVIALVLAVVGGAVGAFLWQKQKDRDIEQANDIFAFKNTYWSPVIKKLYPEPPKGAENMDEETIAAMSAPKGEISAEDLKNITTAFLALDEKLGAHAGLAAILTEMSGVFIEQGKTDTAYELLSKHFAHYNLSKMPEVTQILGTELAALAEDRGDFKGAITILEGLKEAPKKLYAGKIAYDLGRMYREVGETDKAVKQFEYVRDQFANGQFDRLAKIHLQQLLP
jgi:predicted negative regulator of RcsB-dependent stress response